VFLFLRKLPSRRSLQAGFRGEDPPPPHSHPPPFENYVLTYSDIYRQEMEGCPPNAAGGCGCNEGGGAQSAQPPQESFKGPQVGGRGVLLKY